MAKVGKKIKIRTLEKALITALAITFMISICSFAGKCQGIENEVLRFHILANSDSEEDQNLKLQVRDAVLKKTDVIFGDSKNIEEARKKAEENIDEIINIAQKEVYNRGYDYAVNAKVVDMYFPTKQYGERIFPAGKYVAVRITIGEGKGHNWWCVMFPPLCVNAAEDKGEEILNDVLDKEEQNITKNDNQPRYKAKFKIVEIFSGFMDKIDK